MSIGTPAIGNITTTPAAGGSTLAEQQTQTTHLATIAGDTTAIKTAVQIIDNAISGSGVNVSQINGVAPSMGNGASGTGVQRVTIASDSTGVIGLIPATSGGLSIFRSIDLDESEEEAKGTAGQVYGYYIYNAASSERYVKFYNDTAANVVVGSTTPVLTLPIPPGSAANVFSDIGIPFSTAITVAATTGVADADTGAPAANDVIINLYYK